MFGQSLRRRLLAPALLLSVATGAACNLQISTDVEAKDQWTRQYPISATGALSITNGNGTVTLEATDGQTIEVWAERIVRAGTEEAANEQLKLIDMREEASADRVSIDGSTKGLTIRTSRRINFVVKVPRTIAVTLESSNGDISVTGLTGAFRASASNGRITGTDLQGSAHTSTTNGVIALTMAKVTGDVSAETTNGAVTVTLPRDTNASFSARVTNGELSHENLDLQVTETSRRRLDGRLGTGGPSIRVETTNGAVRVIGR
jgi:DUF4097 and DUF4098 domain-containing protein YvlB